MGAVRRTWLNYENDDFFGHWLRDAPYSPKYPGTYIKVRNNPYRTYAGPRSIRTYTDATWTVMSGSCLTGGLPA